MKYLITNLFYSRKESHDLPITLIRIAFGLFFFSSGFNKVFVPENQQIMLHTMTEAGIFYPAFMAYFVAGSETIFGLSLAFGLFSRISSLLLLIINIVALFTVSIHHIPETNGILEWYSWLLYLPESPYILFCILLMVKGAGPLGMDNIIYKKLATTSISG